MEIVLHELEIDLHAFEIDLHALSACTQQKTRLPIVGLQLPGRTVASDVVKPLRIIALRNAPDIEQVSTSAGRRMKKRCRMRACAIPTSENSTSGVHTVEGCE